MTRGFLDWWKGRSLREQRLLLVMFALLAVTILWFGIYRPIDNALSAARARHADAVVRLADTKAKVAALRGLGRGGSAPAGPLATVIGADATAAGFTAASVTPQGDRRVTVAIPSARPVAIFGWIARLEARGIIVERISARANSDPTLGIDMTLTGGA